MVYNLSCAWIAQAQHDYLQGNYPVVRDDAAQMCALQMQADAGPTYLESIDNIEQAVEKFITKPVRVHFVLLARKQGHLAIS